MNDITKIVQALEDSYILPKGVTKTIENKTKEQKGGFLGTLGASLLGNLLTGKGIIRAGSGDSSYENKKGKGIVLVVLRMKIKENGIFHTVLSFYILL